MLNHCYWKVPVSKHFLHKQYDKFFLNAEVTFLPCADIQQVSESADIQEQDAAPPTDYLVIFLKVTQLRVVLLLPELNPESEMTANISSRNS